MTATPALDNPTGRRGECLARPLNGGNMNLGKHNTPVLDMLECAVLKQQPGPAFASPNRLRFVSTQACRQTHD